MVALRTRNLRLSRAGIAFVGAVALAGCEQSLSRQTIGGGIGALGGAAIGSTIGSGSGRTAAIIAGGVLGALVGSEIGRVMDENDRLRAAQATQEALETFPSGETASWQNPDSGFSGTVTPSPAYRNDTGQFCREYTQTISVDGKSETATGVACRESDGSWRILNG